MFAVAIGADERLGVLLIGAALLPSGDDLRGRGVVVLVTQPAHLVDPIGSIHHVRRCDVAFVVAVVVGLSVAVDAFCENIGFTPKQTERIFKTAKKLGLAVKLHAEQLTDLQGASLAARYGALSADHLEYVSENGVKAMAKSGTVAVLLPGAFYFLRETQVPPIDLLRSYSVPIAVSTDCNPGSSPTTSLLLMLNMACTLFRLTPEEALAGVTRNGARALGLQNKIGTLEPAKEADFVVWDIQEPAELAYRIGSNPLRHIVKGGKRIKVKEAGTIRRQIPIPPNKK